MLALLAFAFVLAAALARRMVPGAVGDGRRRRWSGSRRPRWPPRRRSRPGVPAAVLLAGAALCALAIRERPRRRYVFVGALLLAGLPWLGWTFVAAGRRRRVGAGGVDPARAAALRRAGRGRGAGGVAGLLRDDQRPLLRRASRRARRAPPALPELPARLRRAPAAARGAVAGPRRRPAALGAAARRSCSSPAGCCTARAATSSRASRPRAARPRPARGCCSAVVGAQLVVVALLTPAACAARRSRACRWSPCCRRSAALTAWGLRHVPRLARGACWRCSRSGASAWLRAGRSARAASAGGSRSDTDAPWGPLVACSRTSPASAWWPACVCALLAAGGVRPVVARAPRGGRVAARGAPRRARRRRCTRAASH